MKRQPYREVTDGYTFRPLLRGFRLRCCDCALVHILDFHAEHHGHGHALSIKVRRDERATAASRRKQRKRKKKP